VPKRYYSGMKVNVIMNILLRKIGSSYY